MDWTVPFAPVIQWVITLGVSFALGIGSIVWMLLKQATNRFSADAASLRDHLRRHADEEQVLLSRLTEENIDTRRRVGVLHERIEKLDTRISGTPSIDSVHAMALQVERLGGDVRSVRGEMGGLRDIMARVEAQLARHDNALLIERR